MEAIVNKFTSEIHPCIKEGKTFIEVYFNDGVKKVKIPKKEIDFTPSALNGDKRYYLTEIKVNNNPNLNLK